MFSELGKLIYTKIDLITAPIFGVIIFYLIFIYSRFLLDTCYPIEEKYPGLFIVALLYIVSGMTLYAVKRYHYSGWSQKTLHKKLVFLELHTMFHYITYTGILLLFVVFLYEHRMIRDALFNKCAIHKPDALDTEAQL